MGRSLQSVRAGLRLGTLDPRQGGAMPRGAALMLSPATEIMLLLKIVLAPGISMFFDILICYFSSLNLP